MWEELRGSEGARQGPGSEASGETSWSWEGQERRQAGAGNGAAGKQQQVWRSLETKEQHRPWDPGP